MQGGKDETANRRSLAFGHAENGRDDEFAAGWRRESAHGRNPNAAQKQSQRSGRGAALTGTYNTGGGLPRVSPRDPLDRPSRWI